MLSPEQDAVPRQLNVAVTADLPEVRAHIQNVSAEAKNASISPTGARLAVEAHGEILTVPAKHGPIRNLTNTPGAMERQPAWSPDGKIDRIFLRCARSGWQAGLYHLDIAPQDGTEPARRFEIAPEPAYYSDLLWSPDSSHLVFTNNRLQILLLDVATGKVTNLHAPGSFRGFSTYINEMAWSPDSKWLVYCQSMANHFHSLYLFSVENASYTQLTDVMADAHSPAFDRNGKYLYFLASNDNGATQFGTDMSADLYSSTSSIYLIALHAGTRSPIAPESDEEKTAGENKGKADGKVEDVAIDLAGMTVGQIGARIIALPPPARDYDSLTTGAPGTVYFLEHADGGEGTGLSRYVLDTRKTEHIAGHIWAYEISADGQKALLRSGNSQYSIVPRVLRQTPATARSRFRILPYRLTRRLSGNRCTTRSGASSVPIL